MNATQTQTQAQALLSNPDDLIGILAEVTRKPSNRKFLFHLLANLRRENSTLNSIMHQAAIHAARAEFDYSRWLEAEDYRIDAELEAAFESKDEWINTRQVGGQS